MTNATPTIHTASVHDIVQSSRLRRHIAILTMIAYIGQPIAATAEIIADQAAATNNRPIVDATASGLPLVQIATPGAAGVSHNQYTQFNVDPAGLILNNSQSTVLTRQAGYVSANPNLANSAARIILNEITSTSRSQLNGYTEVAGQQAEVIIANPNGITCNGCGFINTSRGVLTTGTPVMGASGSLDAFRVTGGDIQIGTAGLNASNIDQFDLVARSVKVNGELWANNLNVITGANLADYNTLGVQVIQGTGAKPTVGIDVALLGGMYANKITLIGTEAGVGVNSMGNLSAQAGDFTLDNQGQITLGGSTTASGNLTIAGNTSITNSGTLYSQQTAQLTSTGSITNSGLLSAQGNLTLNAANLNSTGILGAGIDVNGNATQNGNLTIATQNQTVAIGTNISGGNMSVTATDINLANSNTNARSGINLDATAGNIYLTGAQTQSVAGDIVLNAAGSITNNQGSLYGVAITSTSAGFGNTSGSVYARGNLNINSSTSLNNSGQLLAQGDLTLNASSLNSSGTLGSGIDVNGNATQNGSILITTQNQAIATGANVAGGNMSIIATDINLANSNTNAWSGINLNATAGNINLTSAQTQSVIGSIVLNATGSVNNSAGQLFGAQVSSNTASFSNVNGALGALGNIILTANSIDNSNGQIGNALNGAGNITLTATGNLTNTGGQIGSDQDLNISANTIAGTGQVIAGRDTTISLQGNYTNTAGNVFKANRNLTFGTTGNFINQTTFESVGMLSVNAANITNQTGAIINANLNKLTTTGDITNAGRIEGNTVETHSNNFNNTATVMGGTLNLYANNLNNLNASAFIGATQAANLIIANALNNQGGATLYSLGDINIGSSFIINPLTGTVDPATTYLAGNAASVTNQSATIEATGNLRISANTITNKRTVVGFQLSAPLPGTSVTVGNPRYTSTYQDDQLIATTTAQSMLLSGGSAWLQGNISNEYSTIASGMNLNQAGGSYNQLAQILNRYETRTGQQDNLVWVITGTVSCGWFSSCYTYGWVNQPLPYSAVITTQIGSVNATFTANNHISVTATTVSNQAVSNGAVGGTAATLGATLGSSQGSVTVNNHSNALNVPTSGLYTLRTQPNQAYLVVTDPRFTSYQNFVSSDYMLSRLSLDPQQIQKRLGDGFYEQKLVTDQITAQTGRRYLGDYTDAQSQFIALLDAGVTAAKDLQLVPGIALTTKQIDALTQDMVWMEEREVTLPNGSTERVLAPQVYLTRLTQANLSPGGALIAANDIHMTSGDSISNSGTIQGRDNNILQAKNITNRGGVIGSQGFTLLKADNDIFNLSGKINGKTVGLNAGRDIVSERLTGSIVLGSINMPRQQNIKSGTVGFLGNLEGVAINTPPKNSFTTTLIHGAAGITATDSLDIYAGRDVIFAGSSVKAGGNATISTGRDLKATTVTAQESANNLYGGISRTEQLTSGIQTGGNLNLLSGSNMRLTSATLEIGKDAALIAGGDLTLDASKNVSSYNYDTAVYKARRYDETVLGSTLNAGGNVNLVATQLETENKSHDSNSGHTDDKGNINLNSAAITSNKGNVTVMADANVNIGVTEEKHESFTEIHTESKGITTTTQRTTRDESWRTDTIGSSLSGNNIRITSGKDINVEGSSVSAEHNIDVAAMGNVNITAATDIYGSQHYANEHTSGLQINNAFNITDSGPEIISKSRTDATNQSYNRSSLASKNGNLNILTGGDLVAVGTDLVANAGEVAFAAGGTAALLAGQDTLSQESSTFILSNPNFFTKQRRTITDSNNSLDYLGSTVQGNSVKISGGADIILQATDVKAGEGGINLDAGRDIQLLVATNTARHTHQETLATDGMLFSMDGGFSDRRKNNKSESQTVTNQVTKLTSAGNITTHSWRNTRIEASTLDAQGSIDLSSGNDTTEGSITLAAIKNSSYSAVADSHNSIAWQSSTGHGVYKETIQLANIKAGKGINVNATGGVIVDIPEVPAEPTPPAEDTANATDNAEQDNENPAEKATRAAEDKRTRDKQRLTDHLNTLAKTTGQEWIGQLAKQAKAQPDSVKLQQVNAAAQHWDYAHEGLTPEAAAVIAIAVTYGTAGMASEASAGIVASAGATGTTATVASAAVAAGMTTLASQATISLINNKGHVGKTLEELGRKESVKALVTAMATAGALQSLNTALGIQDVNAKSTFTDQLQKNIINQSASAVINHAMYGGDLQQQLEQSLKSAFIDTGAAQGANLIGDLKGTTLNDFTHKLAHAIAGCAAGAAKSNDCSSGALGAVVGEIAAEFYGGNRTGASGPDLPTFKTDTVNFSRLMSGIAALLTGNDVNLAAASGGNAAENNYLDHKENEDRLEAARGCANGDAEACNVKDTLDALDKARDEVLNLACQGNTKSDVCKTATKDMRGKLDTYFQTQNGVQLKDNVLSTEEQNAGLGNYTAKTELQSYVDLLAVSNQQRDETQANGIPTKTPDKYDSDPYKVMNPEKPDLYMAIKVGDQWGVVGKSDGVYTSMAGVNGQSNSTNYAPGLMGIHVEREFANPSLYTLYYNPTEGGLMDTWESAQDKVGFTTPVTKKFSQILDDVQAVGHPVSWVVHSQGGVIFSEAVRFNGGNLSKNSVVFHAGANNQLMTNAYLQKAGINSGNKTQYVNSHLDFVPNVVGFNGNPLEMWGSTIAAPLLFMGPTISPHTLPPKQTQPSAPLQGVTP